MSATGRTATILHAETGEPTTTCPTCQQTIDVERNQRRARQDRDLLTKPQILETLTNIDEPVTEAQLDQWIRAKRLRIRGWLQDGKFVRFRINANSHAVYSLARARKLRRRDDALRSQPQEAKAQ